MRSKLFTRLEKLEAMTPPVPTLIQYGWLARLPDDFVGERHVVITERERTGSDNIEWCQFEERPGPAPAASHLTPVTAIGPRGNTANHTTGTTAWGQS